MVWTGLHHRIEKDRRPNLQLAKWPAKPHIYYICYQPTVPHPLHSRSAGRSRWLSTSGFLDSADDRHTAESARLPLHGQQESDWQ